MINLSLPLGEAEYGSMVGAVERFLSERKALLQAL
jgi:hypothetical protein